MLTGKDVHAIEEVLLVNDDLATLCEKRGVSMEDLKAVFKAAAGAVAEMKEERRFPIMIGHDGLPGPCPSWIPWSAIAPYEGQAKLNHDQTLERLAQRGGLGPEEAYLVMTGKRLRHDVFTPAFEKEACAFLDKLMKDREPLKMMLQSMVKLSENLTAERDAALALNESLEAQVKREHSDYLQEHHAHWSLAEINKELEAKLAAAAAQIDQLKKPDNS